MEKDIFICTVAVYAIKGREFDNSGRALIAVPRFYEAKTPVRFQSGERTISGHIESCVQLPWDAKLIDLLQSISGKDVHVFVSSAMNQ